LLRARDDHGATPLHLAAAEGHLDQIPPGLFAAELLGLRNREGLTPIDLARKQGHVHQLPARLVPPPGRPGTAHGFRLA
jgi:ankyrin repeat protein